SSTVFPILPLNAGSGIGRLLRPGSEADVCARQSVEPIAESSAAAAQIAKCRGITTSISTQTRAALFLFQLHPDLFYFSGESERRLVAEIDGRSHVLADIQSLADAERVRGRPGDLAAAHVAAVRREGHGAAFAELARPALVGETDGHLGLALGQRL